MLQKLLEEYMPEMPLQITREAGNHHVPVCGILRKLALEPQHGLSKESMECLFLAQRIENAKWFESLDKESIVISDRG